MSETELGVDDQAAIPGFSQSGGDDLALRPVDLEEFVGQQQARRILRMSIAGAKSRGEPVGHSLIYGPRGLGKTTLARIIAIETNCGFRSLSGPTLQKVTDVGPILASLVEGDVVFVDEIHRMSPPVSEMLYTVMEDFRLDLTVGEPGHTRAISIPLPRFTLVGATTMSGMLMGPLRDRFGINIRLSPYTEEELTEIALRSARLISLTLEEGVAGEVARRSRGTPRLVNNLLRRLQDAAAEARVTLVGSDLAEATFELLGIDHKGLDESDRRYLDCLRGRFRGGPVGLKALATALGEDSTTLENEIEPWLLRQGLLDRTHRGRMATETPMDRLL